jgi:hypothetical protein
MDVFSIGLGLDAANTYFDANRAERKRRTDEERERRRWETEQRGLDAKDTVLPSATEAQVAGYENTTGAARAESELRPLQTGIQRTSLERAAGRQDALETTADLQAGAGLDQATVAKGLSGLSVEQLPKALRAGRVAGTLKDDEVNTAIMGGLAKAIDSNDPARVLKFYNDVADIDGEPRAAKVGLSADNQNFVALDANGQPIMQVPLGKLRQMAYPIERVVVPQGSTVGAFDPKTGGFIPSYTNPKQFAPEGGGGGGLDGAGGGRGGRPPADVAAAEWLMAQGVKDPMRAWQMVNEAKGMSQRDFVLDYVSKMAPVQMAAGSAKKTPDQLREEAVAIYNSVNAPPAAAPAPAPAAPQSNSRPPATRNPEIDRLLGIP